jgi:hypothetical protein
MLTPVRVSPQWREMKTQVSPEERGGRPTSFACVHLFRAQIYIENGREEKPPLLLHHCALLTVL